MSVFNVCLVGYGNEGKTSYINRFLEDRKYTKEFTYNLQNVSNVTMNTNKCSITIKLFESNGFPSKEDVDAVILFFDLTSKETYKNYPNILNNFKQRYNNLPYSVCFNKLDVIPNDGHDKDTGKSTFMKQKDEIQGMLKDQEYYFISTKHRFICTKPLTSVLSKLYKSEVTLN